MDNIKLAEFKQPLALDLLRDFTERYGRIMHRSGNIHERYFEPELHRLISAFVNEATEPLRKALVDISIRTPTSFIMEKP